MPNPNYFFRSNTFLYFLCVKRMARNFTIKIYSWLAKKEYLNGKYVYKWKRMYVPIPSRFHKEMESFLDQRLKIEVTKQEGNLHIILSPDK